MKTEWDYSSLAEAYLKRPGYANLAIESMLAVSGASTNTVCDIGAGVAHLTIMLASHGLEVDAVEPNDSMRELGQKRTLEFENIRWSVGTGEESGQSQNKFDLVTFGSSFNVCDRPRALAEVARILKRGGWFACMWNHRRLDDPVQAGIEEIICKAIPEYDYGTRRENQSPVIEASNLFGPVLYLEAKTHWQQSLSDMVIAWRSHGTLARQSGQSFEGIVSSIEEYLETFDQPTFDIPYTTRLWMAKVAS